MSVQTQLTATRDAVASLQAILAPLNHGLPLIAAFCDGAEARVRDLAAAEALRVELGVLRSEYAEVLESVMSAKADLAAVRSAKAAFLQRVADAEAAHTALREKHGLTR